jgi:predicted Zn finger-like uncharacterized protein
MLIVCPSCASEYTIDPAKLGPDGRTLRCAICRDTWFVSPAEAETAMPEPLPEEPPGATLLPPAPASPAHPRKRRVKAPPKTSARRIAVVAAATLVAVLALPLLGEGVSKARHVMGHLVETEHADLAFRQVTSEIIGTDGARMLVVEGEITNGGVGPAPLPPLEFLVRNGDEQVLATWTEAPPRPTLGPGETTRFASRLASPPADGRQVRVQFTKAAGVAVAAR